MEQGCGSCRRKESEQENVPAGGEDDRRQSAMDAEVFASGTSRGDDGVAWASALALLVEGHRRCSTGWLAAARVWCCAVPDTARFPPADLFSFEISLDVILLADLACVPAAASHASAAPFCHPG